MTTNQVPEQVQIVAKITARAETDPAIYDGWQVELIPPWSRQGYPLKFRAPASERDLKPGTTWLWTLVRGPLAKDRTGALRNPEYYTSYYWNFGKAEPVPPGAPEGWYKPAGASSAPVAPQDALFPNSPPPAPPPPRGTGENTVPWHRYLGWADLVDHAMKMAEVRMKLRGAAMDGTDAEPDLEEDDYVGKFRDSMTVIVSSVKAEIERG